MQPENQKYNQVIISISSSTWSFLVDREGLQSPQVGCVQKGALLHEVHV